MRRIWAVLVRHRDYRFLLSAGLVSLAGDWVLGVGLSYYVYKVTDSTMASSLVSLSALLPQLLLGSLAGVFVDRWDRRRTMITTNALMAAGLLPLLGFRGAEQAWIAYLVVFYQGCIAQFFAPAESALVPHLVGDHDLVTANALNGQNRNVARLVGAALGGVAAGVGGVAVVTVVDATTFAVAAVLIALIRTRTSHSRSRTEDAAVLSQWRAGLALARTDPVLRVLLAVYVITAVGEGIMGTLFAPFVRDVLHGSGSAYGAVNTAQAAGGIAAGFVVAGIAHRYAPPRLLAWGAIGLGLVDLTLFLYPIGYVAVWPALVCMLAAGPPAAALSAAITTLTQRAAADSHRGRIFGALLAAQGAGMIAGTLVAGALGDVIGIVPVIVVQGVGYLLAGLLVTTRLPAPSPVPAKHEAPFAV